MAGPATQAMRALLLSLMPESRVESVESVWRDVGASFSFVLEAERSDSPVGEWFLQDATIK